MKKLTCSLVLLALFGLGVVPIAANAAGNITAYFPNNPAATGANAPASQRSMDSRGVGQFQTVYIFGEGFYDGAGNQQFINGAQYQVNYGSHFTWVSDIPAGGVVIGQSHSGISIGFGTNIKFGARFLIQRAILIWNSDCTTPGAQNANAPVVIKNQHFPDPTPVVTLFPSNVEVPAVGRRAQICQLVEMDVSPAFCPNKFSAKAWDVIGSTHWWKAGIMAVAVLGSSSVNVNDIDTGSLALGGPQTGFQGATPLAWPQTTWFDVASTDGDNDCACDEVPVPADDDDDDDEDNESLNGLINFDPDGKKDLLLFFRRVDVAAAIGPTAPDMDTEVTLLLTGAYNDGMPFESQDCVLIVEGHHHRKKGDHGDGDHNTAGAGLGLPSPNPFNPVTRIGYNVPSTQHVRIAVYDVAGRLVENLVNEVKAPGEYVVEWDAGNLPSGVYFYRMQTGSQTIVRRATLLK